MIHAIGVGKPSPTRRSSGNLLKWQAIHRRHWGDPGDIVPSRTLVRGHGRAGGD
jgi:hypothetical protein